MKHLFNKYQAAFTIGIKVGLTYRAEMFLWSIIDGVPLLGMLLLWANVIPEGQQLHGYTQASIFTYYLIGFVIRQLTGAHFEDYIIDEIKKGTFSTFLLKPISTQIFFFFNELAWRLMSLITSVIPILSLIYYLAPSLIPRLSVSAGLLMIIVMVLGYCMEITYSLMIAAMGFIFENAKSFMHLRWILGMLFSGILIPFDLMPTWLRRTAELLPFQFRQFTPVQIATSSDSSYGLHMIVFGVIWLLALTIILKIIWTKSVKSFTSVGS